MKNNKTNTLGAIALVLFLSSCGIQKNSVSDKHRVLPEVFSDSNTDSTNIAQVAWKEFFKDEKLIALIDTALANNTDMRQALYRIDLAKSNLRLRKGASLPNLDLAVEGGLRRYGYYTMDGIGNYDTNFSTNIDEKSKIPNPVPDYFVGLRTSWEIDIWGKLKNKKNAALNKFLATYEGQKLVQTELVSNVSNAYLELLTLDEELKILDRNILLQQRSLKLTEIQKEAAMATELGVQQFKAVLANSNTRKLEVLQKRSILQNHINFLCGRFDTPISINAEGLSNFLTDSLANGVPLHLLSLRPDIKQAGLELLASKNEISAAKAAFLPAVVLAPFVGFQSFRIDEWLNPSKSLAYGLVGGISAPILNQNRLKADYNAYLAEYGIAFQAYEKTVLKAYNEVQDAVKSAGYIKAKGKSIAIEVKALNESVKAANALFLAGRATYLDILTTQRNVLDAEIKEVETRREQAQNQINLYKALGGGWK